MKLKGIKKLAGDSRNLGKGRLQVFADISTGDVFGDWFAENEEDWSGWKCLNVISCGWIHGPAKMADIRMMVEHAISKCKTDAMMA